MIEDKLLREQRIRLEALAQSVQSYMGQSPSTAALEARALSFEKLIVFGEPKDPREPKPNAS